MFCYQCEQTAKGTGCNNFGVCGKDPDTAALQDLLVYTAEGVAVLAYRLRQAGVVDPATDAFVQEALFTTVTNVNFDPARVAGFVRKGVALRDGLRTRHEEYCGPEQLPVGAAELLTWEPAATLEGLVRQGEAVNFERQTETKGADVVGLEQLILYGLKGTAAYADHARILGYTDPGVDGFFHEALDFLTRPQTVGDLTAMALKVGEVNLTVMGLLDRAHTTTFGNPVPTPVRTTPVKGKAILVSGHDLLDLRALLEQTAGTGINVYTHGEMLPAHGYPELKKYPHLVGNYGTAWQNQRDEFDRFPGAILMTTNCIQKPRGSYFDRIFTCGLVAWPGVRHLENREFGPVIAAAQAAEGFAEDGPEKTILVGFGHAAVLGVAGAVVDAVKQGAIRHFFLVGGCDGAKPGRNYYTDFVQRAPQDTVILTLACGKYRFNDLELGTIGGIPRLLDVGQCNDAYSAIQIAVALAGAFNTDVNSLPLSLILSWYEQKAVCILLTLLNLGIKNIRLGPTLPAFVTPAVLGVLVEKFQIKPIGTVDGDLQAILGASQI